MTGSGSNPKIDNTIKTLETALDVLTGLSSVFAGRQTAKTTVSSVWGLVADAVETLREEQEPEPEPVSEPTGFGAVVLVELASGKRVRYIRYSDGCWYAEQSNGLGMFPTSWRSLESKVVDVLSEGHVNSED